MIHINKVLTEGGDITFTTNVVFGESKPLSDEMTVLLSSSSSSYPLVNTSRIYQQKSTRQIFDTDYELVSNSRVERLRRAVVNKATPLIGQISGLTRFPLPFQSSQFKGATKVTFDAVVTDCDYYPSKEQHKTRCVLHIGNHKPNERIDIGFKGLGYTPGLSQFSLLVVGDPKTTSQLVTTQEYPIAEWIEFLDPPNHIGSTNYNNAIATHSMFIIYSVSNVKVWFGDYCEDCDFEITNQPYSWGDILANYLNAGGVWDE